MGQPGSSARDRQLPRSATAADVFDRRAATLRELGERAEDVARACYAMAVRFHQGAKLIVFGNGGASTDAQHIAVEFVHPVIVGKRALPAVSLTTDAVALTDIATNTGLADTFAQKLRLIGAPVDIAMGLSADGRCENVLRGLRQAGELGMLTVALLGAGGGPIASAGTADHLLVTTADDPRVVKEVHVTTYHILWELVHIFFEQPGVLDPEMVS